MEKIVVSARIDSETFGMLIKIIGQHFKIPVFGISDLVDKSLQILCKIAEGSLEVSYPKDTEVLDLMKTYNVFHKKLTQEIVSEGVESIDVSKILNINLNDINLK